jgi:NADPH-dependent 2,4-dienoyl-CoA reductase/sulfur reductase-like enzyme
MSAAYQAMRTARGLGARLEVVALDSGHHTSYSACGIPYWIAGDVDSADDIVARTATEHRAAGIDLRLGTTVVDLDLAARTVTTEAGDQLPYDDLVLATGAAPLVPDWARRRGGVLVPGVLPVKTPDDGAAWLDLLLTGVPGSGGPVRPRTAVVVGGGYIGVEMNRPGSAGGGHQATAGRAPAVGVAVG